MFVVIIYDVHSKQDAKVLKLLRQYCFHVQKSVFEAELTPHQLNEIKEKLSEIPMNPHDSIIFYKILSHKQVHKEIIGTPKNKDVLLYG